MAAMDLLRQKNRREKETSDRKIEGKKRPKIEGKKRALPVVPPGRGMNARYE
jgi:hypothetical protein